MPNEPATPPTHAFWFPFRASPNGLFSTFLNCHSLPHRQEHLLAFRHSRLCATESSLESPIILTPHHSPSAFDAAQILRTYRTTGFSLQGHFPPIPPLQGLPPWTTPNPSQPPEKKKSNAAAAKPSGERRAPRPRWRRWRSRWAAAERPSSSSRRRRPSTRRRGFFCWAEGGSGFCWSLPSFPPLFGWMKKGTKRKLTGGAQKTLLLENRRTLRSSFMIGKKVSSPWCLIYPQGLVEKMGVSQNRIVKW